MPPRKRNRRNASRAVNYRQSGSTSDGENEPGQSVAPARRTTRVKEENRGRPKYGTNARTDWLQRVMEACCVDTLCVGLSAEKDKRGPQYNMCISFKNGTTITYVEGTSETDYFPLDWMDEFITYVVKQHEELEIAQFITTIVEANRKLFHKKSSQITEPVPVKIRKFFHVRRRHLVLFAIAASGRFLVEKPYQGASLAKKVWGFDIIERVRKEMDCLTEAFSQQFDFWTCFRKLVKSELDSRVWTMLEWDVDEEEEYIMDTITPICRLEPFEDFSGIDIDDCYEKAYTEGQFEKCSYILDCISRGDRLESIALRDDVKNYKEEVYGLPEDALVYRKFVDVVPKTYTNKFRYDSSTKECEATVPIQKGEVVGVAVSYSLGPLNEDGCPEGLSYEELLEFPLNPKREELEFSWVSARSEEKKEFPVLEEDDMLCVQYAKRLYVIGGHLKYMKHDSLQCNSRMEVVLDARRKPYLIFIAIRNIPRGVILMTDWASIAASVPDDLKYMFTHEKERHIALLRPRH
jgi:hypothetical protein